MREGRLGGVFLLLTGDAFRVVLFNRPLFVLCKGFSLHLLIYLIFRVVSPKRSGREELKRVICSLGRTAGQPLSVDTKLYFSSCPWLYFGLEEYWDVCIVETLVPSDLVFGGRDICLVYSLLSPGCLNIHGGFGLVGGVSEPPEHAF